MDSEEVTRSQAVVLVVMGSYWFATRKPWEVPTIISSGGMATYSYIVMYTELSLLALRILITEHLLILSKTLASSQATPSLSTLHEKSGKTGELYNYVSDIAPR